MTNINKKILIIEDDNDINKLLSDIIKQSGHTSQSAYSGTEAMLYIEQQKWDLILLDLMLPGLSGEEILENIVNISSTPVIIISAKDEQQVKIDALRSGADDFITKPFDVDEVSARIESVLRRYKESSEMSSKVIVYKDIAMDLEAKSVLVNNKKLMLTAREYLILKTLMTSTNKVFSKANIFESVWNEPFHSDDNIVNVHMSHLRTKLANANPDEEYIETIWGLGYKMKS